MTSFTQQLEKFSIETQLKLNAIIRAIVLELAKRVIERTPVKTGRAKDNWDVSINIIPAGFHETFDKTQLGEFSSERAQEIIGILQNAKAGDTLYLTNGVPYIWELETGSSHRQAPEGMIAITVVEYQDIVKKVLVQYGGL